MTKGRLALSWKAVVNASAVAAVVQITGAGQADRFRRGLDADLVPALANARAPDMVVGALLVTLFASFFVVASVLIANRLARPAKSLPFVAAALPTLLLFTFQLFFIAQAALEPPMNVAPFPANSLTYLPNWLDLASAAAGFFLGALVYLRTSAARTSDL